MTCCQVSDHCPLGYLFSKTLHVVSNFSRLAINTVYLVYCLPLACASPVFEDCKIRTKFQDISENLKGQKISPNLQVLKTCQELFMHK